MNEFSLLRRNASRNRQDVTLAIARLRRSGIHIEKNLRYAGPMYDTTLNTPAAAYF